MEFCGVLPLCFPRGSLLDSQVGARTGLMHERYVLDDPEAMACHFSMLPRMCLAMRFSAIVCHVFFGHVFCHVWISYIAAASCVDCFPDLLNLRLGFMNDVK